MPVKCYSPLNETQIVWKSEPLGLAVFPFILELVAVLVGVIIILNKYTSVRKQPVFYYVSIVIGWYLALVILILMPTDISMVCILSYSRLIKSRNDFLQVFLWNLERGSSFVFMDLFEFFYQKNIRRYDIKHCSLSDHWKNDSEIERLGMRNVLVSTSMLWTLRP